MVRAKRGGLMKRKSFAVIGLGRFGATLATSLVELGHDVIGIDRDDEHVRSLADVIPNVLQLDATDERALRAAGIQDVDVAVISIGEDIESSVLVVMIARDLAIRLAHTLVVSNILDFIELSRDISIVEMPAPPTFVGRTLRELELRPRFGLTLIAIKRSTQDGGQITMVA